MSDRERKEFDRLSIHMAKGSASKSDELRFFELDKKSEHADNCKRR